MFIEQREIEIDKWYFDLTSYKLHNYGKANNYQWERDLSLGKQSLRHAQNSQLYVSDLIITERAGARINAATASDRYIILMKHEHVYINHTLLFLPPLFFLRRP